MFTKSSLPCPKIMGILNITQNSFSDGGKYFSSQKAIEHALQMAEDGAEIIDIGGEASNPGSIPISIEEELNAVMPVIEYLTKNTNLFISIDTNKEEVMTAALASGVSMINDIYALKNIKDFSAILQYKPKICLMHMQGNPRNMQDNPQYRNVISEVYYFLEQRINFCYEIGIKKDQIIIDPGIGFGKNKNHNLDILQKLVEFKKLNVPILIGVSRKSIISSILNNCSKNERLSGSIALNILAYLQGCNIFRCHDVKETAHALNMIYTVNNFKS